MYLISSQSTIKLQKDITVTSLFATTVLIDRLTPNIHMYAVTEARTLDVGHVNYDMLQKQKQNVIQCEQNSCIKQLIAYNKTYITKRI